MKWSLLSASRLVFLLGLWVAAPLVGWASPIATDSFEGYTLGPLNGQGGGAVSGWAGNWDPSTSNPRAEVIDTTASPMTYPVPGGEIIIGGTRALEIQLTGSAASVICARRQLATPIAATFYVGYLVQYQSDPSETFTDWAGGNNTFSLHLGTNSSSTSTLNFGLRGGTVSGTTNDFMLRYATGAPVTGAYTGGHLITNTTYYLVLKVNYGGSAFTSATLWLNPSADGETTKPTGDAALSGFTCGPITHIFWREAVLDADDILRVDALKMGSTFSDVVPGSAISVALTNPASGAGFLAPASILLQATASDSSGMVTNVGFYAGATKLADDPTVPYSYSWTGVPAGSYALTAVAIDDQGASNVSAVVNLVVTNAFNVALTNPPNGASFVAPANLLLQAGISGAGGAVTNVAFYSGTTKLADDPTPPYFCNWTNVPVGAYAFTAVATDNQGVSSTSSIVNVSVTLGGTNKIFAYIAAPHNGTAVPAGSSLGVSLLGWSTNAAVSNLTLLYDGVPLTNVAAATGSLVLSDLAPGIHSLGAVATDAASNVGTAAPVYIRAFAATTAGGTVTGELKLWHPVNVSFNGPSMGEGGTPNPFTDYRLDVTFVNGTNLYLVPGYFAADGNAGNTSATNGATWRARFSPVAEGTWTYYASFRTGTDVATNDNAFAGTATSFDGQSGSFVVGPTDKTGADFRAKGFLDYVGESYLRFRGTGEYFLKSGAGSPENFLGYFEFDNTVDHGGQASLLTSTSPIEGAPGFNYNGDGLHHWAPHVADWQPGDPVWQGTKGKGIIGAVNYLGAVGGNSLYFLTMNPNGDGREVYPWTTYASASAPDPNRYRFDCSKLDQWDIVLSHMDSKGIYKHAFLAEVENCLLLDNGDLGKEGRLYYREMVARFSHCLGLQWTVAEESVNTPDQIRAYAIYLHRLDPLYHTVHVHNGSMANLYTPQLGFPLFDGPSLQEGPGSDHGTTLSWRARSLAAGHPWIIGYDETNPADSGVVPDLYDPMHNTIRKQALWGNLMAGGSGCEWYFGYSFTNSDLDCETYRSRANIWPQGVTARSFFTQYLPFHLMSPSDGLSSASGSYCLAQTGLVYAVYLPNGGTTSLNLSGGAAGAYTVRWYDPRNGGALQTGSVTQVSGGGARSLGSPPAASTNDWVILVRAVPAPPPLSYSLTNGWLQLEWNAPGFVLQSGPQVIGSWTNVVPPPASPFLVSPSNAQQYFRLEWPSP